MRAPDRLVRQAAAQCPQIGQFAERLLDAPFPWSKLRQDNVCCVSPIATHPSDWMPRALERSVSTWSTCTASSAFWCSRRQECLR
jgi:hypothetical protein